MAGKRIELTPVLRSIAGRAMVDVPRPNDTLVSYASSDLLMGHYAGLEGIKSGFTSGACFCHVGAAKRGGVELLGVVLGRPSEAARFGDMRTLFDWGSAGGRVQQVVSAEERYAAEQDGPLLTLFASRPATAVVLATLAQSRGES